MIKRLLTKLALWILDGQYVPTAWLAQARKERDDIDLSWAIRYDSEVGFLQEQNREFLSRAMTAELKLKMLGVDKPIFASADYTENVQSPQMIDIRVPKKVRK